jgi:GTP-binding protein
MKINKATYLISSPGFEQCPKLTQPEYAFIGRSNVGKSSIINAVCNQKNLAKTSGTPGKTQLINHFEVMSSNSKGHWDKWYIVDLPGYGFAKVSQSSRRRWEQMIENYLRKRPNLNRVFVLIDSRHEPQKIDLEFIEQMVKWEIPYTLIFTKSDKEKPGAVARNVQSMFDILRERLPFLPQGFVTSAEKKLGVEEVIACIDQYNRLYAEDQQS